MPFSLSFLSFSHRKFTQFAKRKQVLTYALRSGLAILLTLTASAFASPTSFQELPVSYFASLPDVSDVNLSPDGKHLVFLRRLDEVEGKSGTLVTLFNFEKGLKNNIMYSENEKFRINWLEWGNNDKILVSATFPAIRYGTPTSESRLIILDIHTKETRPAIPKRYLKRFDYMPQFQDRIIDLLPDDDDHILMAIDGHNPGEPSVYKVSLSRKKLVTVQSAKADVSNWITDRQSRVRLSIHHEDTSYEIKHQGIDGKGWETLWEFESFAANQVWPLGFAKDPNILYVRALHDGREAIFRVNLGSETRKLELVYSDENYDVEGGLVYSSVAQDVIGVRGPTGYVFWGKKREGLHNALQKILPDSDIRFVSFSRDEKRYIAFSSSDVDPGSYYFGDRNEKSFTPIASAYSNLAIDALNEKNWIEYKARDGLSIEAALTLPTHFEKGKAVPTIIFPHGGPISFTGAGFDYWTQFFANRGYAVLQMNFRGSSGYGHDFVQMGLKNWGLAMQDDVEDGIQWLINQGIADPNKICIVGASYGGYAALMGAVKTPDLYQCAISFAGVSDVAYLVKSHRRYSNYEVVKEQIGSNMKLLRERSPLHNAEKINIPVLLLHGENDRVVSVQHSQKMYRKLQKENKDVEYIELEFGTHFLDRNDNRLETFQAMDTFLKKHLR